ncbi:DEAD/DEAH box helicase [Heliorestis acidaminivorans]|uniref:DEAD/DEAH box helicase n=1 Tax=Heliorestis acidaminivorans TaxID=553427 RepID=A0A6I0EST3_9FIRM|nr:DEAD/DEAH box helicase [Heliorestis acidaminivorans]KAB2952958.1 DEAD/DEAH box helicase [Heliorestis acidaminivorans]
MKRKDTKALPFSKRLDKQVPEYGELKIVIADAIYVPQVLPLTILEQIESELTFINPKYKDALKYGRSLQGIQREIKLFGKIESEKQNKNRRKNQSKNQSKNQTNDPSVIQTVIRLPRGYSNRLLEIFHEQSINYTLEDQRLSKNNITYNSQIDLYEYQLPIVKEAFQKEQGVIESPCGSGKTVMAIYLLSLCQEKTLWVTHTLDLLRQSTKQLAKNLNLQPHDIGTIGAGQYRISDTVTVGLVQSLIKHKEQLVREGFGTVIVDEAHRVPSETFRSVVDPLPAKYRFGITATAQRKDGLEPILFNTIGPMVGKIEEKDLLQAEKIIIPRAVPIFTNFYTKVQEPYSTLMTALIKDEERNHFLAEKVLQHLKDQDCGLLISERIEHCYIIADLLKTMQTSLSVVVLTGKTERLQREENIQKARDGKIQLIVATRVADEGLDIPRLNKLFLATPSRAVSKVKQQVGRIMRTHPDKKEAFVFDFIDYRIPVLQNQVKIRSKLYQQLGCPIS